MNLNVGIVGNPVGWQLLLTQEGVPFNIIRFAPSPEEYSVVVVSSNSDEHQTKFLRAYVEDGGALLCSAQEARNVFQHPIRIRPFHSALPAKEFSGIDLIEYLCSVLAFAEIKCTSIAQWTTDRVHRSNWKRPRHYTSVRSRRNYSRRTNRHKIFLFAGTPASI